MPLWENRFYIDGTALADVLGTDNFERNSVLGRFRLFSEDLLRLRTARWKLVQ